MRRVPALAAIVVIFIAGCSGAGGSIADDPAATSTSISSASVPQPSANATLAVHFINVGQSVSTLIIGPTGETMLIDTGHFQDDGEYVLQYLKRHSIDRLNYLVVSHNDADHIGGNAAIIDYYETQANGIGAIYDPGIAAGTQTYEAYLDAVERYDVTLYGTRAGDQILLEGVDVAVLGPPEPYIENKARNENSLVMKLTYGQTSFLFTGDAEDDQEAHLVSEYGNRLNATILKAGHHGSRSSTSTALIDAVAPKAVVISSAYDSQYGHPHEEVLQRLGSIPTFWTATHGHTVLVSDGQRVSVHTQRAAPTEPANLRASDPVPLGTIDPVRHRITFGGSGSVMTGTPQSVMTDGGTATESLAIKTVHADADGDDSANLNDEYITLTNTGDETLDLSGYTISDTAGHTYTVPDGVGLAPGAELTLYTGSGTDTETKLYWGAGSPIWNNGGDTIIVTTPNGAVILEELY